MATPLPASPLPTIIILAVALPFLIIGLLPILCFGGWSVWRYVWAEREFQAAWKARACALGALA